MRGAAVGGAGCLTLGRNGFGPGRGIVGSSAFRTAPMEVVVAFEIVLVLLLVLANGVFAMAEIAVVSSRKSRLRMLADAGDARAEAALALIKRGVGAGSPVLQGGEG